MAVSCPDLAPFVHSISVLHSLPAQPQLLLPDGDTRIVVLIARSPRGVDGRSATTGLHAVGTRTRAVRKPWSGGITSIAVRFRPGKAYPFLQMPLQELSDAHVELSDIWGADAQRLSSALATTRSLRLCIDRLEHALAARVRAHGHREPRASGLVQAAMSLLQRSRWSDVTRVEDLAHVLGVSTRHLRRAFDDLIGLSPKTYTQVLRFQRAIRLATRSPDPIWSQIAIGAGYFDQAHLIGAFRRFAGRTPTTLEYADLVSLQRPATARIEARDGSPAAAVRQSGYERRDQSPSAPPLSCRGRDDGKH